MRLCSLLLMLLLSGCFLRPVGVGDTADATKSPGPWWDLSPAEIIILGASAIAAAGVLCFVGAFVSFVLLKNRSLGISFLACAVGCIVGAPVLYWVGENLWWVTLLSGVGGLGVGFLLIKKNIGRIESFLGVDLDRDGDIGE